MNDIGLSLPKFGSSLGFSERQIANKDNFEKFITDNEVQHYTSQLLKLAQPYIYHIVNQFDKFVLSSSNSRSLVRDDYISHCTLQLLENIPLYVRSQQSKFTHWVCIQVIKYCMELFSSFTLEGGSTEKFEFFLKNVQTNNEKDLYDSINDSKPRSGNRIHLYNYLYHPYQDDTRSNEYDEILQESFNIDLNRLLSTLTVLESNILQDYFGLNGRWDDSNLRSKYKSLMNISSEEELDDILKIDYRRKTLLAIKYNYTSERIRQLIEKGIRKLRHNLRSHVLKDYLSDDANEILLTPYSTVTQNIISKEGVDGSIITTHRQIDRENLSYVKSQKNSNIESPINRSKREELRQFLKQYIEESHLSYSYSNQSKVYRKDLYHYIVENGCKLNSKIWLNNLPLELKSYFEDKIFIHGLEKTLGELNFSHLKDK